MASKNSVIKNDLKNKRIINSIINSIINVNKIRKDFPIFKKHRKLIYLDNAATTQKPKQVIDRICKFYTEENSNVHRGIYDLSENASKLYDTARKKIADFINAEFEEVIFVRNATEAVNLAAYSLARELKADDEVAVSVLEHHSNFVVWQQLSMHYGFKIKYVNIDVKKGVIDVNDLRKKVSKNTKIIAVSHASNTLGTLQPVDEIIKIGHENGAYVLIDGAQSVPHIKVDVKKLDCDFFAFSGHKMLGPLGIGVLYGKREILEKMEPFMYGGGMLVDASKEKSTFIELPYKFEAGTPNIAGAIGLCEAVEYLGNIGIDNVKKYIDELTEYAYKKLSRINNIKIYSPLKNNIGVISFSLNGIHPHDISYGLNKYNICVRAGKHCTHPLMEELGCVATVRVSFYIYNTKEEIDALVDALNKIVKMFK